MTTVDPTTAPPVVSKDLAVEDTAEDARTQRRRLAAVWLAAGSAVAAMVAVSWYVVVRGGGLPPGGDMVGHAAAAEWLRTLPWWDWRGWSNWFYGGQAIGVNYPPLAHAWMRFIHPTYGQMAAVTLGLLVLLPWGALRLARAVGYAPRAQRAAVGAVLVLTAVSGRMHWVLSGFHQTNTFFSSWPAMLATVLGLFCAAWAARCRGPVVCGVVAGVAVLFNATVVPGVAVVCAVLLIMSGASFRQGIRWAATATAAATAVAAWWLVPFLAGWARLVRWTVPLSVSWNSGDGWQVVVLVVLAAAAAWAARSGPGPSRRLATAAAAGLLATLLGDLFGYLRPERWLVLAILVAAVAAAGLCRLRRHSNLLRPARPAWAVLCVAFLLVFVVITLRLEALPLAVWLLWWPRRTWAWAGALAWAAILVWVPLLGLIRNFAPPEPLPVTPLEAAVAHGGPGAEGLVYLDGLYNVAAGDVAVCAWGHPWRTTIDTGGSVRPLLGLYRESSPSAEFIAPYFRLGPGGFDGGLRPHWFSAWQGGGSVSLDGPAGAEALGARWYAACDPDGNVSVTELPGTTASGVAVAPYSGEEAWHMAAVDWWVSLAADAPTATPGEFSPMPVLSPGESGAYPLEQEALGVSLQSVGDNLTVRAESAGWAWLRVPWDPDWRSLDATPVRKGGPGHLVVWANEGVTELRWSIRGAVDVAAAATTGAAVLAVVALAAVNRRRGWATAPDRPRPAADALGVFADIVDGWVHAATRRARRLAARAFRRSRS